MSQVIAGIYEIDRPIGAGGVGTAYLGWHLRLNKQVVLKADRRTLAAKPESLRREVDLLKSLSHTYIPQVYDFVEENGVVYTVMDYIAGESLDKPLKRGERFEQPRVIRWACELLEALCYLHSRPPYGILHGDIKPANIMLRPDDRICLIDFNIALALGENGAVKAGSSRGYASPEQYAEAIPEPGSAVSERKGKNETASTETVCTEKTPDATENLECTKTLSMPGSVGSNSGSSSQSSGRLLDARSDIYSLGATLYHLISGKRPEPEADKVVPLTPDVCSRAVAAIIQKAMEPDPGNRYQSAQEMLEAFRTLGEKDPRTIRYRRAQKITGAAFVTLFLISGAAALVGSKQMGMVQEALALSEYSENALRQGKVSEAVTLALQAVSKKKLFAGTGVAQAQYALTEALGVYQLADSFQDLDAIELPAAPLDMVLSQQGNRLAVLYAWELALFDTETQDKIIELPLIHSALADAVFLGEDRMIYAGENGVTCVNLATKKSEWTVDKGSRIAVSEDESLVAVVSEAGNSAYIYRALDGEKVAEYTFDGRRMQETENTIFADPRDTVFSLSQDGSVLAVSFSDGSLSFFDSEEEHCVYRNPESMWFEGGFCRDNFVFAAGKKGGSSLYLAELDSYGCLEGYSSANKIHVRVGEEKVYLSDGGMLEELDLSDGTERECAYTDSAGITEFSVDDKTALVVTDDQRFSIYNAAAVKTSEWEENQNQNFAELRGEYAAIANRDENFIRILKLEQHPEAQLLSYDAGYVHDEARISQDQKTTMLFGYSGFRIYDLASGELRNETVLPDAEKIYDQQFRKSQDVSLLEVTWYDGTVRCYSAADGTLLSEEKKAAPDRDLEEEFETKAYRIHSSLHEAPKVYDAKTGKYKGTLEEDAYLTYVNEVGEYLIMQYVSADGRKFGYLLNQNLEKLAYLPGFCDLSGEMLIFDDESGNLRQSRLYSLRELIALGESIES